MEESLIPPFDKDSGQLPPGRYLCTLDEVEENLVEAERFSGSTRRRPLFDGLVRYLVDWEAVKEKVGARRPVVRSLWVAGSFASDKLEPGDIDLTVVVDGAVADAATGRPGSGAIKHLITHRDGVRSRYGLEVFPLRWYPVVHAFRSDPDRTISQLAYLSDRGRLDDWWERCRVDGLDLPSEESCESRRGYLEVRL